MSSVNPFFVLRYQLLKRQLQSRLLEDSNVRIELRRIAKDINDKNQSLAKLSADFNAKNRGANKTLREILQKKVDNEVWDFPIPLRICKKLKKFAKEKTLQKLQNIEGEMFLIEEEVLKKHMPLALHAAKRYASNIFNIEVADATQEASKGIVEAIEKFKSGYVGKTGQQAKFSTFAYAYAIKRVKDWIMTQSRLVKIPKNKLKTIFLVLEAASKKHNDISSLTRQANKLLTARKGDLLTEDEVTEALTLLNNNSLSLDSKNTFTFEENSRPKTIGDFLASNEPDPEVSMFKSQNRDVLLEKLKGILTDLEFFIIFSKYLGEDELSLREVQENIKENLGKNLSRERINQIKFLALEKLSQHPEVKELLHAT